MVLLAQSAAFSANLVHFHRVTASPCGTLGGTDWDERHSSSLGQFCKSRYFLQVVVSV